MYHQQRISQYQPMVAPEPFIFILILSLSDFEFYSPVYVILFVFEIHNKRIVKRKYSSFNIAKLIDLYGYNAIQHKDYRPT